MAAIMPREVFISYCSEDEAAANEVREALESRGIACWIAPRDISGGQTWAAAIVGAIEECRVLLVIVSGRANRSRQMSREVELADARKRRILPVRIESVEPRKDLEYFVSNRQWIDLFPPPVQSHKDALVSAVIALRDADTTSSDVTHPSIPAGSKRSAPVIPRPVRSKRAVQVRWLIGGLAVLLLARSVTTYLGWTKSREAYLEFMTEGDQYAHAEMWLDAINWYDMALAKNPPASALSSIYNLRCHANLQAQMVDQALNDCKRSIELEPGRFKAHLDLGEVYQALKEDAQAMREFEAALSLAKTANDIAGQQIASNKIAGARK